MTGLNKPCRGMDAVKVQLITHGPGRHGVKSAGPGCQLQSMLRQPGIMSLWDMTFSMLQSSALFHAVVRLGIMAHNDREK